ncbi:uncharacterized protein EAF02_000178 [Botrytis sinoallii]|uniref:uncharacterized protein n=1 Tax=Botrytis sinoallii TaxID=1463999 RepID=UPI001901C741|nr:uncharacterized protein EAF02_000178 [Botrytis sinoallii]KAF7892640.1 hypothetical protein EAF02_000178 [Botrytis sinoallii]
MTEISDYELHSSNDNRIGDTSDHEYFDDFNIFDSDQEEEDYGAFQDFDDFSDNQDSNQDFAPSPSGETNVEGLTMSISDVELAEDRTSLSGAPSLWHCGKNTFQFENYPSTPAFMQVCQQARKYGREYFYAVDAKGVPHDFTDPQQVDEPYFYVNPISDDFILKFGDETFCPSPMYCPIQFSPEYMRKELRAKEKELYKIEEEEEDARYEADIGTVHVPVVTTISWGSLFQHIPATPASVARPAPHRPGEPIFPPASVLPHFFDKIRSVGINLSLDCPGVVGFEAMSAEQLQQWTEDQVNCKFDKVFKKIMDRLPHLEHVFVVVRAYGRSNRCESDRGFPRELEKKKWTSVGMEKGTARRMGYREFKQFENQAKVWLMHERIDRGMQLNRIDFGLYVQTNILWEI